MLQTLLVIAATAAQPWTNEQFTINRAEISGPCALKITGKSPEAPPADCAVAIAAAKTPKEKAILYFIWAYSLNEADASLQALPNLDKAVALAPNFGNARHERNYTLNDLGLYERALADGNRAVEIAPHIAMVYHERAFARRRLADFEGSLADRRKAIALEGPSPGAEREVITDLMWLARYDEAAKRLATLPATDADKELRAELDRRRGFKPDGSEAERCDLKAGDNDRSHAQKLVDDCTWAFDHETDRIKRADYLTVRRVMSVIARQDREANVMDLQIAAALDPSNPKRRINLGNTWIDLRHSWAARNEFDAALASASLGKTEKAMALAGRGRARSNLGDLTGAKNDAKASIQIEPGMANIWLAGDLAFQEGNKEAAKRFWMMVYRMGIKDDSLMEQLKSVGVADPEKEPR